MRRCANGWPKALSRSARGASGWRGTQQTALAKRRPSSTPWNRVRLGLEVAHGGLAGV